MANTFLTPADITRKALPILHNKLPFIGSINRQYDSSFAKTGGKIGSQLKIRKPLQFDIRTGRTLSTNSMTETSDTLTVATQAGVDLEYFSDERALSMDDFADRYLKPAMSRLASYLESQAMNMTLDVYNQVGAAGTTPNALLVYLQARQKLEEHLAPTDDRTVLINSSAMAATVNALSSLFHESRSIAHQYKEGFILRNSGFDFYESQLIKSITHGTMTNTTPVVNGSNQGEAGTIAITGAGATATVVAGQVFTVADVYDVNPETGDAYSSLKQFVVTAAATCSGGAATLSISPTVITSGAYKNVSAALASGAALTWVGTASTAYAYDLAYHKDAFTFATADLPLPMGTDNAARKVMDGISLRYVQDYDIVNDRFIGRFDVLFGKLTTRAEHACRIIGN